MRGLILLAVAFALSFAFPASAQQPTALDHPGICPPLEREWRTVASGTNLAAMDRVIARLTPCPNLRAEARRRRVEAARSPSPQPEPQPRHEQRPPPPPQAQSIPLPEMVRIPGQNFEVGRHEVTRAQWAAFVQATSRPDLQATGRSYCSSWRSPGFSQTDNHPVTCVSWEDAQAYVQWLSQRTGQRYRLLTSAEWEIAARAGTTTNFWWGDQDPVCDRGARNGAQSFNCTPRQTSPVGSFQPNGFGLYDVHGNVAEWVENCDLMPSGNRGCLLRGGSLGSSPQFLRSADSGWALPSDRVGGYGLRVARTIEGERSEAPVH